MCIIEKEIFILQNTVNEKYICKLYVGAKLQLAVLSQTIKTGS
jgi:hypothetical protein